MIWLDKPLADADEAAVHEAALQQVVDGLEEERSTLVGQAALPLTVLLTWEAGGHIEQSHLNEHAGFIKETRDGLETEHIHM